MAGHSWLMNQGIILLSSCQVVTNLDGPPYVDCNSFVWLNESGCCLLFFLGGWTASVFEAGRLKL